MLLERGQFVTLQNWIDSVNKPESITYLRRSKERRIIQVRPSFLSLRPNGKVRAKSATSSATKPHTVGSHPSRVILV